MYYDEAMTQFRKEYKEKNICLLFEDEVEKTEFFFEIENDEIINIMYCVIKYTEQEFNNTVGYIDHLKLKYLLSKNWSVIERE